MVCCDDPLPPVVGSPVVVSMPGGPPVESAIGGVLFVADSRSTVTHPIRRVSISAATVVENNFMQCLPSSRAAFVVMWVQQQGRGQSRVVGR